MNKVKITEKKGVRHLHLGSPWIQGSMRLNNPDALELRYVQQMMVWVLFNAQPQHIVQLGLGAGSLTKFCYRHFPNARITAVELSPAVIDICRLKFALPCNDGRLNVTETDALDYVANATHKGRADILQVDLYDGDAREPFLGGAHFYTSCASTLSPDGIMVVNLLGGLSVKDAHIEAIGNAFEAVAWLPETPDANVVAIAFKKAPQVDFSALYEQAQLLEPQLNLPVASWVDGLQEWMQVD